MKNNFFLPITDENTLKSSVIFKQYIDNHQQYLQDKNGGIVNIFYGVFPKAIWHGGRTLNFFNQQQVLKKDMEKCISYLNEQKITARMVFTNSLIQQQHLTDEYCNTILEVMDNGYGNGIIVASDLLENYIRKTHPNLPLISSITKGPDLNTFIQASQRDYEMIVIYAKNNILEYIEKTNFDKNKIEILISSGCGYCPFQQQHYEIESYNNLYQARLKSFKCYRGTGYKPKAPSFEEEIVFDRHILNTMGYNNFKIQGRGRVGVPLLESQVKVLFQKQFHEEILNDLEPFYKI